MKRIYVLCFVVLLVGVMISGVNANEYVYKIVSLDNSITFEYGNIYGIQSESDDDFEIKTMHLFKNNNFQNYFKIVEEDLYGGAILKIKGEEFFREAMLIDTNSYSDYYDINSKSIDITFNLQLTSINNSLFIGKVRFIIEESDNQAIIYGMIIEDTSKELIVIKQNQSSQSQKISSIETWQQTMNDWKTSITTTINNILTSITGLVTTTDDHEERIETLETSNSSGGGSDSEFKSYLKYLGDSDKKKILCGYAQERHLMNIRDLGLKCDITYKLISFGREKVSCVCKK